MRVRKHRRLSPAGPSVTAIAVSVAALLAALPRRAAGHALPPKPAGAAIVCTDDFEGSVTPSWSTARIETTPRGKRRLLGRFGNETVTLTLRDLPPHTFARVSLDLHIIGTWDGNRTDCGPDVWSAAVRDGPTLLRATFRNADVGEVAVPPLGQTYPDDHPGPCHPGRLGASETDALGYTWRLLHKEPDLPAPDTTYRLRFTFPHSAPSLLADFAGSGLQEVDDESWGLDNVTVEVLPEPPNRDFGRAQLSALWTDLAGENPVKAAAAVWDLVGAGDTAVAFLAERVKESGDLDAGQVGRLIRDLADDDWAVRERASRDLTGLGPAVAPLLREALKTTTSADTRFRIELILAALPGPGTVPFARVRRVLELIGTDEANRLLRRLPQAAGPPAAHPTTLRSTH